MSDPADPVAALRVPQEPPAPEIRRRDEDMTTITWGRLRELLDAEAAQLGIVREPLIRTDVGASVSGEVPAPDVSQRAVTVSERSRTLLEVELVAYALLGFDKKNKFILRADAQACAEHVIEMVHTSMEAAPLVAPAGVPEPPQSEQVTTFTPLFWLSLNEDQQYEEYIRVRQLAAVGRLPALPETSEAERTVASIAAMLGWMNVPPRDVLEQDIAALKARASAPGRLPALESLVDQQAEDEGLWFVAQTAAEAYLQQELRRLHAAIEGRE